MVCVEYQEYTDDTSQELKVIQAYTDYTDYRDIQDVDDAYSPHFQAFLQWKEESGIPDTLNAVPEYFKALNQSSYAAGTIRIKRSAVINRLRRAADSMNPEQRYRLETFINRLNKDAETKSPKINTTAVGAAKVITESEYQKLLIKARSARQRAFMMFLWETGCRVDELTGVTLQKCKQEGKAYNLTVRGKGKKERHVYIKESTYNFIREIFKGEVYLFETDNGKRYCNNYISKQVKKLAGDVIGRSLSAHCWRHSTATRLIDKTNKIEAVSRYLGHASVSTTLNMYVHQSLSAAEILGADVLM